MERHQIIEMMRELRLSGMRAAFDEILANGLKRQHSIPQIIGDLLQAEIAEKAGAVNQIPGRHRSAASRQGAVRL